MMQFWNILIMEGLAELLLVSNILMFVYDFNRRLFISVYRMAIVVYVTIIWSYF